LAHLRLMTPERRLVALSDVERRARTLGLEHIVEVAARAIAHDQALLDRELGWCPPASPQALDSGDCAVADSLLGRTVSAFYCAVQSEEALCGADPCAVDRAKRVTRRLFAGGICSMVTARLDQDLARIEALLEVARGELARDIEELGLGGYIDRLSELAGQVKANLENEPQAQHTPDSEDVHAARAKGHENLAGLVAEILTARAEDGRRVAFGQRLYLLAPVLEQNAAAHAAHRFGQDHVDVFTPDVEHGHADRSAADRPTRPDWPPAVAETGGVLDRGDITGGREHRSAEHVR